MKGTSSSCHSTKG